MSKIMIAAAAVVATVSAATAVPAMAAQAAAPTTQHEVAAERASLSDQDVIELFTGQGRIIAEHPELAKYVPGDEQQLTPAQLSATTKDYQNAYPQFHDDVTVPLQSGDPYQVLDALHSFETATERIAASDSAAVTGDGKCVVVLAVGVLVWAAVSVKVKFWGPSSVDRDSGAAFASELTRALH